MKFRVPQARTAACLAHLGLDGQADERAIRKAYAQRLKRIDQVNEAQAFQDLRQAYEAALRWAAWQRQMAVDREAEKTQPSVEAVAESAPIEAAPPAPMAPRLAMAPSDAPSTPRQPEVLEPDAERFETPHAPEVLAETVLDVVDAERHQACDSEDDARHGVDRALAEQREATKPPAAVAEPAPVDAAPPAPMAPRPALPPSDAPSAPRQPEVLATDAPGFEAPPTPEVLAETVFAGLVAWRDRGLASEDEAQQALDHALADDRLVNLEARAMFEWRLACLLAEGWRPGHEFLFGPASKTFHWDTERRGLAVFGRVGQALDAAIQERLMFFGQGPLDFNAQRQMIQRLRLDEMPDAGELIRSVPTLHMLAQRYPQWLHMITSQSNFNRWTEAFKAIPAAQSEALRQRAGKQPVPSASPAKDPFQKQPSSFNPWWLVFVVVMLFGVFTRPSKPHMPPSTSAPWTTPAQNDGFKLTYDLFPSDPVATQPAGWPPATKEATPWGPPTVRAAASPDPARRQSPVEAELEKAAADPVAKSLRDEAGSRVQGGAADSSPTQSADAYLEQQRKRLHAVEGTLPELDGSLLSSPDTGKAPRLSYDLTQPADAASAAPRWSKPDKHL